MSLRGVPFTYPYPRPALTCDAVVFTMRADDLAVLLVRRKEEPFKGRWALPGGFVNENESLERAAARELSEETGISGVRLEQLGAYGDPGRDPRGHTVTIAFVTFLVAEAKIKAGDDAAVVEWHAFRTLALEDKPSVRAASSVQRRASVRAGSAAPRGARPRITSSKTRRGGSIKLAFDHAKIVADAYRRLAQYLDDPLRERGFDLLPARFTLTELHHFYEIVGGRSLPQRSFKKRLIDQELVVRAALSPTQRPAAQLYRWNRPR